MSGEGALYLPVSGDPADQLAVRKFGRHVVCALPSAGYAKTAVHAGAASERFILIRRGWNSSLDILRDSLWSGHPQAEIVAFGFFHACVFNRCERGGCVMMTFDVWRNVHPMPRVIPGDWPHTAPFGVMHALKPSG